MLSSGTYPWFSHRHDAEFHNGGQQLLTVFDNGKTRHAEMGGNSRGQTLNVDVRARTVTLANNQDTGAFSPGLGSAQILANGDYMYLAGETLTGAEGSQPVCQNIEFTPSGAIILEVQMIAADYRDFRVADLYHPPNGAGANQ